MRAVFYWRKVTEKRVIVEKFLIGYLFGIFRQLLHAQVYQIGVNVIAIVLMIGMTNFLINKWCENLWWVLNDKDALKERLSFQLEEFQLN